MRLLLNKRTLGLAMMAGCALPAAAGAQELCAESGSVSAGQRVPAMERCFSEDSVLSGEAINEWRRRIGAGRGGYGSRFFAPARWNSEYGEVNAPVALTWSLVPDGTVCSHDNTFSTSTLFATMDSQFGGNRDLWIGYLQSCFDNISSVCGARFTRVTYGPGPTDDGAGWPDSFGETGRRGDMRVCSYPITDNTPHLNTLAYCFYPSTGDLCLDSAEAWNQYANSYRFMRNVCTHELGHGMGLDHSCPGDHTKLMEPIYSSNFDALQHDDILGLQYLYGDAYEPNNTAGAATVFLAAQPNTSVEFFTWGQVANSATASVLPGDQDWVRSSLAAEMPVTLTATPKGRTYDTSPQGQGTDSNPSGCTSGHFVNSLMQTGLIVEIRDSTNRLLASAQGSPGQAVTVSTRVPGGNFYSVVKPVSSSFAVPQMYTLTRTVGAPLAPRNDPWYEGYLLNDGENGTRMAGTTFGATTDGHAQIEPGGDIGVQDVYYNFSPWDGAGAMRVTVTGGHVVSVHRLGTQAPSITNQLFPIDSNGGGNGVLDVNVPDLNTYVIRVARPVSGTAGPFEVAGRYLNGPSNDDCSAPVNVTEGAYPGTTIYARPATTRYPVSCTTDTSTAPAGVWYRYSATANGTLSLSVCNGSNTILGVYDACPESGGSLVACNDNAAGCGSGGSALTMGVTAGRQYLIRVSNVANLSHNFTLNVGFSRAGETCENAVAISEGDTPYSNAGYTSDDGSCNGGANRWYLYTARGYSTVNVNTCGGTSYDSTLAAWSGCPSAGGQVLACNDDWCGLQSSITLTATPGQQFWISVGGYQGSTGTGTLHITETPVPGEVCSHPIVVGDGETPYSTLGHYTNGPAEPNCNFCCGDPQIHGDLWYLYFANASGTLTVSTCGADYDSKMVAYDSCPTGEGHAIACADDECGVQAVLHMEVIAGRSYLIRVGGYGGWTGSGVLSITPPATCPADFNQDGGVDGSDVQAFFEAWENGVAGADVNADGGIDGADVEVFFAAWELGSC